MLPITSVMQYVEMDSLHYVKHLTYKKEPESEFVPFFILF